MKILIIGLGSIAKKHIRAIKKIDKNAEIFALRSNKNAPEELGITNLFSFQNLNYDFDFCIISNPTYKHFDTINNVLNLKIPLFIEKPALMNLENAEQLVSKIEKNNILTYVALNLRFHPVIQFLKSHLENKNIIEANIYCGSYLPDWRPDKDYTNIYSTKPETGGGVHLDLIHEIDYTVFLFGMPKEVFSVKRKISDLKITSKDIAVYHFLYDNKIINITLNYYRKFPKRELEIVTDNNIITADLINSEIRENDTLIFSEKLDPLFTYEEQMKYFYHLIEKKETPTFNSLKESLIILEICLNQNT